MSIGWVALSSLVCRRRHIMSYHIISCHIMLHKTHDIFYIFGKKRTQGYQIQWHLHIMSASTVHHQYIIKVSTVQHQCIICASSAHHCFAFIAELSPVYCCLVLNCLFVFLSFCHSDRMSEKCLKSQMPLCVFRCASIPRLYPCQWVSKWVSRTCHHVNMSTCHHFNMSSFQHVNMATFGRFW